MEVTGAPLLPSEPLPQPHIPESLQQANRLLTRPEAAPPSFYPEIAALSSLSLDANPKFTVLKRAVEQFTQQRKTGQAVTLFPGKSQRWTEVMVSALLKALTELLFVREKKDLDGWVDRIYVWYIDKTRAVTELPQIRPRHVSPSPCPPIRNIPNSQDNSLQARHQRLLARKLDAIPPIEARTPSPSKSPHVPMPFDHSLLSEPQGDEIMEKYLSRVKEWRNRELAEFRGRRMSEKLVHQWSTARAKREEDFLARAEVSRPRGRTTTGRRDTDVSCSDLSKSVLSTGVDTTKASSYVDFRSAREKSETPSEPLPTTLTSPTRADRLRLTSKSLIPTQGGVGHIKHDRCSLAFYPPNEPQDHSFASILDLSISSKGGEGRSVESETVSRLKRKLVAVQVACSYQILTSGLHRPEELARVSPEFLPRGGEYLTVNPFSKLGKKKKKGKKKGKKKK